MKKTAEGLARLAILAGMACGAAVGAYAETTTAPPISLDGYRLTRGPLVIEGVSEDASGITYSPAAGSLFVILNGSTEVVELGLPDLRVKRRIQLSGFEDTEDIAWIEGSRFAVVEERRRRVCLIEIRPETRVVSYAGAAIGIVETAPPDNDGLEGICPLDTAGRFVAVKEKRPKRIYTFSLAAAGASPPAAIRSMQPWDAQRAPAGVGDLAAVYAQRPSGPWLLLSDESRCIVACTPEGAEIERLWLTAGHAGLKADIPQPEGLTLDLEGNLYVCGEPNLLYVFGR